MWQWLLGWYLSIGVQLLDAQSGEYRRATTQEGKTFATHFTIEPQLLSRICVGTKRGAISMLLVCRGSN